MQKVLLIFLLLCAFEGKSQAPGVLDCHAVSEQHSLFFRYLDISDEIWDDIRKFYGWKKLKLEEGEDTLFEYERARGAYPFPFGMPYNNLFHENDHWALRVYKTIDFKTANNQLFSRGAQNVRWTRESDRSVTADTTYETYVDSKFLDIMAKAIEHEITLYAHSWFDYIPDDDPARDSLAKLLYRTNKLVLKEDYYYDRNRGTTESFKVGLGFFEADESGTNKELFWVYFPELRYYIGGQHFAHFNHKLNWKFQLTYKQLFDDKLYDVESVRTVPHTINLWSYAMMPPKAPNTDHDTDIDALFAIAFMKEHLKKDYKKFNGKVNDKVAEDYHLVGDLRNGIMQGKWEFQYDDGSTRISVDFINNVPHGAYTAYWPNGKLKEIGQFEYGLRSGEWKGFFENGKKLTLKNYKAGWMDGKQEVWYKNGKQHMVYHYRDAKLNGEYIRKTEKGKLLEKGFFTNDLPDAKWEVNLYVPQQFVKIIENNADLEWDYPAEAFTDGVLSYTVLLEQGDFKTNCPSPVFDCVRMVERSKVE